MDNPHQEVLLVSMETNKVKEKEENIMDIGYTHVVTSNKVVIKEKEIITENEVINNALRAEIDQLKMDKEEQNDHLHTTAFL